MARVAIIRNRDAILEMLAAGYPIKAIHKALFEHLDGMAYATFCKYVRDITEGRLKHPRRSLALSNQESGARKDDDRRSVRDTHPAERRYRGTDYANPDKEYIKKLLTPAKG